MARAAAAPQGPGPSPGPGPARSGAALPGWAPLAACRAREPACASAALGTLAGLLWLAAHALLFRARCRRKGWQDASVPCILYSFVGSLCNTIGAVLADQLAIQILAGACMAAVDIARFLLTLFPVCASEPDRPGRRRRQARRGLFALALPLCVGPGGLVLATAASAAPEEFPGAGRRLLGTARQESAEVLGFALGTLAALVALTARIPSLSGACRGRPSPGTQRGASVSSALASILYAAAVVVRDQQPAYVLRAAPWLLLALGCAGLDVAMAFLSGTRRSRVGRQPGSQETRALLARAEEEDEPKGREGGKVPAWLPLSMSPAAKCPPAGAAVGRCLALSLEQVQQAGCRWVRLPGDGQTSAPEPPARPRVQPSRAKLSSSSSADASSLSLEWDFEDVNLQWSRTGTDAPNAQQQLLAERQLHV